MFMPLDCELIALDGPGDAGEHADEHAAIPLGSPTISTGSGRARQQTRQRRQVPSGRSPTAGPPRQVPRGRSLQQTRQRPRSRTRCHSIGASHSKHRIGPERASKHANDHAREHAAILLGRPTISTGSGPSVPANTPTNTLANTLPFYWDAPQ